MGPRREGGHRHALSHRSGARHRDTPRRRLRAGQYRRGTRQQAERAHGGSDAGSARGRAQGRPRQDRRAPRPYGGGEGHRPVHPAVGAPLMLRNQTMGIDLPMKALAWEDERGQVWLTYNAPAYLAERHGVSGSTEALEAMRKGLERFTDAATRP